ALYFVDWDNLGRAQKIEILDGDTGAVLDTQSISSFNGGQYLCWDVAGKIKVRITRTGGQNAILNGIFFDAPSSKAPPKLAMPTAESRTEGKFAMELIGESGATYIVERSTDLKT